MLSIDRILSLPSLQQNEVPAEEEPAPVLSPLRESEFHPVALAGVPFQEAQPLAFAPFGPAYPCLVAGVWTEGFEPLPIEAAVLDPVVVPYDGGSRQKDGVLHGRVVAAEMRSGFCLGPAGLIQILTAVVVVKDEVSKDEVAKDEAVVTANLPADENIDLAVLLETVGRSIMPPNADPIPTAAAAPARKVARRKARPGTRRRAGASSGATGCA